jgi:hypothetical protein
VKLTSKTPGLRGAVILKTKRTRPAVRLRVLIQRDLDPIRTLVLRHLLAPVTRTLSAALSTPATGVESPWTPLRLARVTLRSADAALGHAASAPTSTTRTKSTRYRAEGGIVRATYRNARPLSPSAITVPDWVVGYRTRTGMPGSLRAPTLRTIHSIAPFARRMQP